MERQTFYQWICQFAGQDSQVRHFARVLILDKCRPRSNKRKDWEFYLEKVGASFSCKKFFLDTWEQYELESINRETFRQPKRVWRFKNHRQIDNRGTLLRPALPSYWDSISPLVRVRLTARGSNELKFGSYMAAYDVLTVVHELFSNAVEQFSNYFQRELNLEFRSYTTLFHKKHGDKRLHPYLFFPRHRDSEDASIERPIGACEFTLPIDSDAWVLDWVWIHPFYRHKGYLSEAWNWFRLEYGHFKVQPPLSTHMQKFLSKYEGTGIAKTQKSPESESVKNKNEMAENPKAGAPALLS